jgi:signal transduction histidine kinase
MKPRHNTLLKRLPTVTSARFSRLLGEARSRIFLWYVMILGIAFLMAVPAFRYFLEHRIDERVRQDMTEDMTLFQSLVAGTLLSLEDLSREEQPKSLDQEVEEPEPGETSTLGDLAFSAPPKTSQDLMNLFRLYLLRRPPEDESYFITFMAGEFYKSSPRARPQILDKRGELMQRFAGQTQPEEGFQETTDEAIGKILYRVEPIQINGQVQGVFVVAHATAGERAEAFEAILTFIQIIAPVFIVSMAIAWLAAGRVLSPLRTMTATAHAISETDLTQRLPVNGQGELAELALTFNEMMDRLETAFATQREFINDAGHELRTPITIIRGHLELMGDDPEEQAETLQLVMSELDRMSRMVDDLILLAKAERTDFLRLETVDVAELTDELYAKATALAKRNWQLENNAKGRVVLDRQRITEAVMNLAQNATQHTQETDIISLGSGNAKGRVLFWVRDTGEGIPAAEQQRIFERFARVSTSRRRSEGAGLGLAIVRAIAEAHGGQVQLRSQFGVGSTFTLVLPLDPPQEVNAHVAYSHR